MSKRAALILIPLLLLSVASPGTVRGVSSPKVPEPVSVGPYPVGVTTTVFVDSGRTDNVTREPRTLVTEIWYPADDSARGLPRNRYRDFIPGGATPQIEQLVRLGYGMALDDMDRLYWNHSVRDAKARKGRFPLVVFSHGNGGMRFQNTFWCDYLASHGYIVVSADHTGNARITILNGKVTMYQASERENSARDRPIDMSYLLTQMIAWDKGADKRFAGRIDTDRACAAGMSFGAFTAITVADKDPRFKSVIAMSGAPETNTNLLVPSLRMVGTEDRTIREAGNARVRQQHARHEGPSFLLELKDGGHYSFTDMFKINRNYGDGVGQGKRGGNGEAFDYLPMELTYKIINSYSVAFLGYYVKGQREYRSFLESNHWPDALIWEARNGNAGRTAK